MDRELKGRREGKKRANWPKGVDLILRSSHICTASILFGGIFWAVPYNRFSTWHHATIITGSALIVFNIYRCRHWPYQGRGLAAAIHVSLLWFVHSRPEMTVPLMATLLTVGVVGSHMPAFIRHWSLVHRRILD